MKYQEFKELILKIDINNIEFDDETSGLEVEKAIEHLYNIVEALEAKFNFEVSHDYLTKKNRWAKYRLNILKRKKYVND